MMTVMVMIMMRNMVKEMTKDGPIVIARLLSLLILMFQMTQVMMILMKQFIISW